jgi:hypothetical protein
VSGAGKNEPIEYQWSLDGDTGPKTKSSTYNWKGNDPGYYEVAVVVFGSDRTATKSLTITLLEGEPSQEESSEEGTPDSESTEISELTGSLEAFLEAAGVSHISPSQLVVAGGGIVTLIAIWMIVNRRAGVPMEKLEGAVRQWRGKDGPKPPLAPPETKAKPLKQAEDKPFQSLPEVKEPTEGEKPPASVPEEKGGELRDKPNLCPKCGHPNTPGANFCNECGASI